MQLLRLDLSGNGLQALPAGVAQLPQLATLLLYSNPLRCLPGGAYLARLQRLDVAYTNVE